MQQWQQDIATFIKRLGFESSPLPNSLPFSPFYILYFSEKKLAFHLIQICEIEDDFLFQELSKQFNNQGIKLIHLAEDVWIKKTDLVKSRIIALFGKSTRIHARLCEVRRITQPEARAFLEENHLQDSTVAKFKFGLFVKEKQSAVSYQQSAISYQQFPIPNSQFPPPNSALETRNSQLVAVATFGAARKFVREGKAFRSFEMIRFANLRGCTVVGGLDKLLKAFMKDQQPDDIMTYADRDWSDGGSYQKLGFQLEEITNPHIFLLDKQLLIRKLYQENMVYDVEKFIKIANAGSLKFRIVYW